MAAEADLKAAFDAAIEATKKCRRAGMPCVDGASAEPNLQKLEDELVAERGQAVARGFVNKDWVQKTVRWLVQWVPESEITLIAALGRIVRTAPEGRTDSQ